MEKPKEYDIVNPLWQRGYAIGIAEERARNLEIAKAAHPKVHNESPRPLCPVCMMVAKLEDN